MSEPMKSGTTSGTIKTPMTSENIGRQGTPGIRTYPGTPSSSGSGKSGSTIKGPGNMNAWK